MSDQITFIRHSQSRPIPGQPPSQWALTETGRQRCAALAEHMRSYTPELIVCSTERKTIETGALVARHLSLPHCTAPDLHEHLREQVGWLSDAEFARSVAALFAQPDELVFGEETANAACARFTQGISAVLAAHPHQRLAIVTHGTVLALFLAQQNGFDPQPFWRGLGMPALVVTTLPNFQIREVIAKIASKD